MSKNTTVERDKKGNIIHVKFLKINYEYWREVDEKNRCIHYRNSYGSSIWSEYGEYGEYNRISHEIGNTGKEHWYKIRIGNEKIKITEEEFEQLREQEFLKREQITRFKLMEILT